MDRATGASKSEAVQRLRGAELREHLIRSKSVALIKVRGVSWFLVIDDKRSSFRFKLCPTLLRLS